jgi:hypothetical protein
MNLTRTIALWAGTLTLISGYGLAQELPPCTKQRVTYDRFDEPFAWRMVSGSPQELVADGVKNHSPDGTSYVVVRKPDYSKPGPWNTVASIGRSDEAPTKTLTFLDHANGDVTIHWLNEKLLYGSVWWGRIVATDFIFDVERGEFIYREMANYGAFVQPCKK